jgi:predicted TIM-barrel fold metal-dependent hydrolase
MIVSPLLRGLTSDEVPALTVPGALLARAAAATERAAAATGAVLSQFAFDRRATAVALREIDAEAGGGFYAVPEAATVDEELAAAAFARRSAVVDVQTHLVDPGQWRGTHAEALGGFLRMVDPQRWSGEIDPNAIDAAAWAALVFGASETDVALLTSTPGPQGDNVLANAQIAAARDVIARYGDDGRVLTHTIVHPDLGVAELDRMVGWHEALRPSAWKVYTLYGAGGGWFLDDAVGESFLARVAEVGPRIVCAHKGLGGPIPDASVATASPRDIGPAAAAWPDIRFVVYHSGYERDPVGQEGAFDAEQPAANARGVDRLVHSLRAHGIRPGANVYAELGSTWYLMLRRPVEAAHVLGKLLDTVGSERVLWGTDSTWYGTPQPLIDAFRAFSIPQWMQDEFGYAALSDDVKTRILGANARDLYGITDATIDAIAREPARAWAVDAAPALRAAIEANRP